MDSTKAMKLASRIKHRIGHPALRWGNRSLETPANIFLFVTNLCNLYCEHCFYHAELNKNREGLTVVQLERLASSLTRPPFVCLTGGEPMLLKNLFDMVSVLSDTGGCEHINVCTNGYYPDRSQSFALETLQSKRLASLGFQISLDGSETMHNDIRQNRFSFNKAIETLKLLSSLQEEYPHLKVSVLTVITRHNFDDVAELLHTTQNIGVNHGFSIVRGTYSVFNLPHEISSEFDVTEEAATVGVSPEEWEQKIEELRRIKAKYRYDAPTDLNLQKLDVTVRTLREKKRVIPCYAGSLDGVIYPNGDVAMCETSQPFGNLRDTDYNLHSLWNSEAAAKMREKITGCACIHACNLITSLQKRSDLHVAV
jgi:MoaA/NifB/PqqE/SkfB family radical SAM enzyme